MASSAPIDPRLQYGPGRPSLPPFAANESVQRGLQQFHAAAQHHQHPELSSAHQQPYYLPPANHGHRPQSERPLDPALEEPAPDEDSPGDAALPDDGQSNTTPGSKPSDAKRPRACDSCRGLKVKCIIDPTSPEPCKRCAKAGRACIVTPPTRKRQRKADSRVAELERKIDALTASLQAQRTGSLGGSGDYGTDQRQSSMSESPYAPISPHLQSSQRTQGKEADSSRATHQSSYGNNPMDSPHTGPNKRRRIDDEAVKHEHSSSERPSDRSRGGIMSQVVADAVDRNIYNERKAPVFDHSDIDGRISKIIDEATAEHLFDRYVNEIVPHFPAVPFPPGTKASTIRNKKPILFLAIMSSTCYGTNIPAPAQRALELELREEFANSMWKHGEKSLQIIQALQIATLWYRPPGNFEQHMFYQMTHMSAIMAVDIGMGRTANTLRKRWLGPEGPFKRYRSLEDAEARRAWLVCYILCVSITMVLRRPILLRYNDYMRECIEYLQTADDALPSDKLICQHVKLTHIAEEIAHQFSLDDASANVTISDGKVTYGIKHFEKDLQEQIAEDMVNPALKLAEHVTSLYLHEIALHFNHNTDDFKAPFPEDTFKAVAGQVLGPNHIDALAACQSACLNMLDEFLSIDFNILYILPVMFSVRVVYTMVVLLKLYVAATTPGEISTVIRKDELRVDHYLAALHERFTAIMEQDSQSPHAKFLFVVQRLDDRYSSIKQGESGDGAKTSRRPSQPRIKAGKDNKEPASGGPPSQGAQGLQLLSEVAMHGTPQAGTEPNGHGGNVDPRMMPPGPGWYAPSVNMAGPESMDPYQYSMPMTPFDNLDFTLANMGMDPDITGLFVPGAMWNFQDPGGHSGGNLYQGW